MVLVSVDGERDTAEKLKTYVRAFHANFYAARGDKESIARITREMGIVYEKMNIQDNENYDVLHSGTIMLFNPQGQLNAFFTTPHQAKLLAADYELLVN